MSDTNETTNETPTMTLLPEEVQNLNGLRQGANQLALEIGNLEVRKARLLGNISEVEANAQTLLNRVGIRLQIPDGQPWQVSPTGEVVLLDPNETA